MQRYFVIGNIENITFYESDIFHIERVMRFRDGDEIEVVLNGHIYLAKLIGFKPIKVSIISEIFENRELSAHITLLYCLPKGDKLDLVIQKATEIGVSKIIGVISKRVVVRIDQKDKEKKLIRYNKIIKEASEQSKRNVMPIFEDIIDYKDIKKYLGKHNYIAYEKESLNNNSLMEKLSEIKGNEDITILVGAEGGFEESEVNYANEVGFKNVSLGKLILRSETAAIYFLSVLSFMLNR